MLDLNPTVGEVFKAKAVTDDEVNAAVEAYLANPETGALPIADGYSLNPAAAVPRPVRRRGVFRARKAPEEAMRAPCAER